MAAATTYAFRPGDVIAQGRYRIEAPLGQGGFGAVYRATQAGLGRGVALKVLHQELLAQDDGLARFQREAMLAQRLEHPNTVRLYDFGQTEQGVPFIAFELLRGESLDQAIRRAGPMSAGRVARISTQVLKSLMEAHALGIVHRDIKPGNVFLCEFQGEPDFVKVLDFGIAKATNSATSAGLTQAGLVVGTPQYMPPEQLLGNTSAPSGDLYALGLTMAEALYGRIIVGGNNASDIVMQQLRPEPLEMPPQVLQSPLGPVILRATNKDVSRRYASAAEMLADLEALLRAHGGDLDRSTQQMTAPAPMANVPTAFAPSPNPGYAGSQPYLPAPQPQGAMPMEPRRAGGGGGAAVIVGVIVALVLLGAVGSGVAYYLYARDRGGSSHASDDDGPTKTKDKEVASKKNVADDDDVIDPLDAKATKKKLEDDGWKIIGDTTTHNPSLQVVTYTIQKGGDFGGVYIYLFDDEKVAAMTEGSMSSSPQMVVRRHGKTMVAAYASSGKSTAKAVLDDLFPP